MLWELPLARCDPKGIFRAYTPLWRLHWGPHGPFLFPVANSSSSQPISTTFVIEDESWKYKYALLIYKMSFGDFSAFVVYEWEAAGEDERRWR